MCITTLGSFASSADQAYYIQQPPSAATPVNFILPGEVNQAIKIYGNAEFGDIDYRNYFKAYLKEQGKTFDIYDLIAEQDLSGLTYKKYALSLSNSIDVKITHSDEIVSGGVYSNIGVTYYDTPQQRSIGGTNYSFDIIIDGDSKTAEQIYEKIQYLLRSPDDINKGAGTVRGDIADELLTFLGNTLVTANGVYIDNFQVADINRIEFYDINGVKRTFPYIATGYLNFNEYLTSDSDAKYWMFFTSIGSSAFGTSDAILVNDSEGNPITGIPSAAQIEFTFDYEGNNQGGRNPNIDAPVTAVAIGLQTAKYYKTTTTLQRSKANVITFVSDREKSYGDQS